MPNNKTLPVKKYGVLGWPGNDNQAVKTYGLLKDAGYFSFLTFDHVLGYTLVWALPTKTGAIKILKSIWDELLNNCPMLNQITPTTEVKCLTEKNLSTFTIEVGLHPADVEKILTMIADELREGCQKTKATILKLNQEREYIQHTLNVK